MNSLPFLRSTALRIHPDDNVAVALADLHAGVQVKISGRVYKMAVDIPMKHKFALHDFSIGDSIIMYGIAVGEAIARIRVGECIGTTNTAHRSSSFHAKTGTHQWNPLDVSRWENRTFLGYRRADGQVGTRNYWLVVPLVFCENRNVRVLQEAFESGLGSAPTNKYRRQVEELSALYVQGNREQLWSYKPGFEDAAPSQRSIFPNVDGVKFLTHEGGCGGTREDARLLCGLIAGYIHHPNVAGATILSLGCQNAQVAMLRKEISRRTANLAKPLIVLDHQHSSLEFVMLSDAIRETFIGLIDANRCQRTPAPLSKLVIGLKCGGSDGFSGISANPVIGQVSDMMAALNGKSILAEFPELCGVEQSLIDRAVNDDVAKKFIHLMKTYAARAEAVGSGFDMNPSPGNIKDGLITDAMKSAGAVKKGGTSPVMDVLDYPEYANTPGLNLLCTPGNDVEAVTGEVGAGANIVLFTTGLGTPTGNPICPVVKLASNTNLAHRMADIIDFDCGPVATGRKTIEESGEAVMEYVIQVASGALRTKAELLHQEDFIPWKRGISL